MKISFFLIVATLLLTSCASISRVDKLYEGMPESEAIKILGKHEDKSFSGPLTTYEHSFFRWRDWKTITFKTTFKDDKLINLEVVRWTGPDFSRVDTAPLQAWTNSLNSPTTAPPRQVSSPQESQPAIKPCWQPPTTWSSCKPVSCSGNDNWRIVCSDQDCGPKPTALGPGCSVGACLDSGWEVVCR